jgi:hypothetical protein
MAEVIADYGDVDAGLQQGNGTAVSKHVGRDAPASQCRDGAGRQRRVFLQDVGDAIARETCAAATTKHPVLRLGVARHLQSL